MYMLSRSQSEKENHIEFNGNRKYEDYRVYFKDVQERCVNFKTLFDTRLPLVRRIVSLL